MGFISAFKGLNLVRTLCCLTGTLYRAVSVDRQHVAATARPRELSYCVDKFRSCGKTFVIL